MNRRNFFKGTGSTGVIVAASCAGIGTFITACTLHEEPQSWNIAGTQYAYPMRRASSFAILVPNPHNRQPWVIDLKSDAAAVLSCDLQPVPVLSPLALATGRSCRSYVLSPEMRCGAKYSTRWDSRRPLT